MEEGEKSKVSIRWGWLIIIIIIIFILFKVDIKEKIQSEQFQENISYVKEQIEKLWDKITDMTKTKAGEIIINSANEELDKIQKDITENIKN